jgi:hypothetical protein
MSNIERYQTDNLFLLVGTNPLPNYVAAKVLWNGKGQVFFLVTSDTNDVAQRIQRLLGLKGGQFTILNEVESSNAAQIFKTINEKIKTLSGSIGLNYTGGTKAMGIHAYRAAEASKKSIQYSYLDAKTLEMCFDVSGHRVAVGALVTMDIEQMLQLHNWEKEKPFLTVPERPELLDSIVAHWDEWQAWTKALRQNGELIKKQADFEKFAMIKSAHFPTLTQYDNLFALAQAWKYKKLCDLAKWLEGTWLESYVLREMQAIADDCHLNAGAVASGIQTSSIDFELDVVAVRGYQLIVVSCTVDATKGLTKHKLIEAYLRARQIGGDEARFALVCMSGEPSKVQDEIKSVLSAPNQVKVFGKAQLPTLREHLKTWINEQPLD